MTTDQTPAESLLLRHLRGLLGQAVCLHRGDDCPIGLLLEVDAGHALLETGVGDRVLLPLAGLDRAESGPGIAATLEFKRWLHRQYGERVARTVQEREERSLLEALDQADSGQSPLEALVARFQANQGNGR